MYSRYEFCEIVTGSEYVLAPNRQAWKIWDKERKEWHPATYLEQTWAEKVYRKLEEKACKLEAMRVEWRQRLREKELANDN